MLFYFLFKKEGKYKDLVNFKIAYIL